MDLSPVEGQRQSIIGMTIACVPTVMNTITNVDNPSSVRRMRMPIYRVTFTTELLVESDDDLDAEKIARCNLYEEVRNGLSEVQSTELVEGHEGLRSGEVNSLPWRDRSNASQATVGEVLFEIR